MSQITKKGESGWFASPAVSLLYKHYNLFDGAKLVIEKGVLVTEKINSLRWINPASSFVSTSLGRRKKEKLHGHGVGSYDRGEVRTSNLRA